MAQLPPKFPSNISPNSWPSSWSDEFFDFTSAKRGSHRRTLSDSVTFLESASAPPRADVATIDYDCFDEEELMSMFSDDLDPLSSAPPSTAPSTPSSDRNSVGDQEKQIMQGNSLSGDQCEAQSGSVVCGEIVVAAVKVKTPQQQHLLVDAKKAKRILANRQSAQRSRVRKLQYISDLEKSVNTLQTEVSALSPRVALLDHQRTVLSVGNSQLKQRIAALAQDKIFKDAHREALQNEIERLRMVYHQQHLKKWAAAGGATSDGPPIDAGKKLDMPGGTEQHPSGEC